MLTLADALEALTQHRPSNGTAVITEAAIDSRQVIPGSLFVAIPGENVDGHDFVQEAFRRGASFALVQKDMDASIRSLDLRSPQAMQNVAAEQLASPVCLRVENTVAALQQIARFWRRKLDLRVIGITGSVGKSTTKEVVAQVLNQRYRTLKSPGNLNNEIGLPLTILRLSSGYQRAVLEMGFYVAGEVALLCDIALPQVGVVSNVGTVHAERAGSQEAIARGKAELVQALPPAPEGVAVLNFDDPWVRKMQEQTRARVFFYGLSPEAEIWADQVESLGLDGIRFRLHYHKESLHARVPMIGRHSVHTALRAAAVGLAEGLTWQEIFDGLQRGHTQLRLVAVRSASGALILDDTYNASPESMLAALNLLSELEGRKIAVLGDMLELGPGSAGLHRGLKEAVDAAGIDLVFACGPMMRMLFDQLQPARQGAWTQDSALLAPPLLDAVRAGDVVMVKGSLATRMAPLVEAVQARFSKAGS